MKWLVVAVAVFLVVFPASLPAQVMELTYSTYLGGNAWENACKVALGPDRAMYITGTTQSTDFPTLNPYQGSVPGGIDAYVGKLSSDGTALLYSTYLGGSAADYGMALAVDSLGRAAVTGYGESDDFPTVNPYQAARAGMEDLFVSLFSSSGSALVCSTYVGGESNDRGQAIVFDSLGRALVAGRTSSNGYPTANPYQASRGSSGDYINNVALTKISASGSALVFSTYLGGDGSSDAWAVALDSADALYLTGMTAAPDFPTLNPYQASLASPSYGDIFLAKLTTDASALLFSTYLGGSIEEIAYDLDFDSAGQACIFGNTFSLDFPTLNPYQASNGGAEWIEDAILAKFSTSGSALIYSTFLGGADHDYGRGLRIDSEGRAFVAGWTLSSDFPTRDGFQPSLASAGKEDAYLTVFAASGSAVSYSTYFGGSQVEYGLGLRIGSGNDAYLVGQTESDDFPIQNPWQSSRGGSTDAFVSRISIRVMTPTPTATPVSPTPSATPSATATATSTPSPTPSQTPTPSPTPTATPSPSRTPTPVPTASPSPSPTASPSPSRTPTATPSPSPSKTPTATPSPSPSPTPTPSPSPSPSPSKTPTATPSPSPSPTPTPSPSPSPSPSQTPTAKPSPSPSATPSPRPSATATPPPTAAPTPTPAPSSTTTPSPEPSPTRTPSAALEFILDSGDYDGDGTSDIGIFRPSEGRWAIRNLTSSYFGAATDFPVPADYNGDGTADMGIFRGDQGMWSIRNLTRVYLGTSTDALVPGDYRGNGTAEAGIFRPSAGMWSIRNTTRIYFGNSTDRVTPGDYNGDGRKEAAIFRPSSILWSVWGVTRFYYGAASDDPVPGDFDGNGTWEGAVFRGSAGMWSARDVTRVYFGGSADAPLPADYDGDGGDEIGIFRPAAGMWSVLNLTRLYFGASNDIPVTR